MQLDLRCYICKKQYWSYGWYLRHIKECRTKQDTTKDEYYCNTCNDTFFFYNKDWIKHKKKCK